MLTIKEILNCIATEATEGTWGDYSLLPGESPPAPESKSNPKGGRTLKVRDEDFFTRDIIAKWKKERLSIRRGEE